MAIARSKNENYRCGKLILILIKMGISIDLSMLSLSLFLSGERSKRWKSGKGGKCYGF
jgi:hypothetical protein